MKSTNAQIWIAWVILSKMVSSLQIILWWAWKSWSEKKLRDKAWRTGQWTSRGRVCPPSAGTRQYSASGRIQRSSSIKIIQYFNLMVLQKVMIFSNYGNGIRKSDEKSVLWDNKPLVQWNEAEFHQCINCFRVKTISNFNINIRDSRTRASRSNDKNHDHENFKVSDRTRTKNEKFFPNQTKRFVDPW